MGSDNNGESGFLKGPICMEWIRCLGRRGGKVLLVALELRREADMRRSCRLELSASRIARNCGIARSTALQCLKTLAQGDGKIVETDFKPGRRGVITLLDRGDPKGKAE